MEIRLTQHSMASIRGYAVWGKVCFSGLVSGTTAGVYLLLGEGAGVQAIVLARCSLPMSNSALSLEMNMSCSLFLLYIIHNNTSSWLITFDSLTWPLLVYHW